MISTYVRPWLPLWNEKSSSLKSSDSFQELDKEQQSRLFEILNPKNGYRYRALKEPCSRIEFSFSPLAFLSSFSMNLEQQGFTVKDATICGSALSCIMEGKSRCFTDIDLHISLDNPPPYPFATIQQTFFSLLESYAKISRTAYPGHRIDYFLPNNECFASMRYTEGRAQSVFRSQGLKSLASHEGFMLFTIPTDSLDIDISITWGNTPTCLSSYDCRSIDLCPLWVSSSKTSHPFIKAAPGYSLERAEELRSQGLFEVKPLAAAVSLHGGLRGFARLLTKGSSPVDKRIEAAFIEGFKREYPSDVALYSFPIHLIRYMDRHYESCLLSRLTFLLNLRTTLISSGNDQQAIDGVIFNEIGFTPPLEKRKEAIEWLMLVFFWKYHLKSGGVLHEGQWGTFSERMKCSLEISDKNVYFFLPIPSKLTLSEFLKPSELTEWKQAACDALGLLNEKEEIEALLFTGANCIQYADPELRLVKALGAEPKKFRLPQFAEALFASLDPLSIQERLNLLEKCQTFLKAPTLERTKEVCELPLSPFSLHMALFQDFSDRDHAEAGFSSTKRGISTEQLLYSIARLASHPSCTEKEALIFCDYLEKIRDHSPQVNEAWNLLVKVSKNAVYRKHIYTLASKNHSIQALSEIAHDREEVPNSLSDTWDKAWLEFLQKMSSKDRQTLLIELPILPFINESYRLKAAELLLENQLVSDGGEQLFKAAKVPDWISPEQFWQFLFRSFAKEKKTLTSKKFSDYLRIMEQLIPLDKPTAQRFISRFFFPFPPKIKVNESGFSTLAWTVFSSLFGSSMSADQAFIDRWVSLFLTPHDNASLQIVSALLVELFEKKTSLPLLADALNIYLGFHKNSPSFYPSLQSTLQKGDSTIKECQAAFLQDLASLEEPNCSILLKKQINQPILPLIQLFFHRKDLSSQSRETLLKISESMSIRPKLASRNDHLTALKHALLCRKEALSQATILSLCDRVLALLEHPHPLSKEEEGSLESFFAIYGNQTWHKSYQCALIFAEKNHELAKKITNSLLQGIPLHERLSFSKNALEKKLISPKEAWTIASLTQKMDWAKHTVLAQNVVNEDPSLLTEVGDYFTKQLKKEKSKIPLLAGKRIWDLFRIKHNDLSCIYELAVLLSKNPSKQEGLFLLDILLSLNTKLPAKWIPLLMSTIRNHLSSKDLIDSGLDLFIVYEETLSKRPFKEFWPLLTLAAKDNSSLHDKLFTYIDSLEDPLQELQAIEKVASFPLSTSSINKLPVYLIRAIQKVSPETEECALVQRIFSQLSSILINTPLSQPLLEQLFLTQEIAREKKIYFSHMQLLHIARLIAELRTDQKVEVLRPDNKNPIHVGEMLLWVLESSFDHLKNGSPNQKEALSHWDYIWRNLLELHVNWSNRELLILATLCEKAGRANNSLLGKGIVPLLRLQKQLTIFLKGIDSEGQKLFKIINASFLRSYEKLREIPNVPIYVNNRVFPEKSTFINYDPNSTSIMEIHELISVCLTEHSALLRLAYEKRTIEPFEFHGNMALSLLEKAMNERLLHLHHLNYFINQLLSPLYSINKQTYLSKVIVDYINNFSQEGSVKKKCFLEILSSLTSSPEATVQPFESHFAIELLDTLMQREESAFFLNNPQSISILFKLLNDLLEKSPEAKHVLLAAEYLSAAICEKPVIEPIVVGSMEEDPMAYLQEVFLQNFSLLECAELISTATHFLKEQYGESFHKRIEAIETKTAQALCELPQGLSML